MFCASQQTKAMINSINRVSSNSGGIAQWSCTAAFGYYKSNTILHVLVYSTPLSFLHPPSTL